MVNQLLVTLVNSILGYGTPTARGNYSYFCPVCKHHKRKLEINFDEDSIYYQNYHCWNINCSLKGKKLVNLFKQQNYSKTKIEELYKLVGNKKVKYNLDNIKQDKIFLPKEFKNFGSSSIIEKHALLYLKNRGVNQEDIIKYNLGYCEEGNYKNRIIIPSYGETGELNYFIGRTFEKNNPKKYQLPPFSKNVIFFEYYINWNLPILLCEGVFDAISIKRNVIPLLGGEIQPNLMKKLLSPKVKEIYIILDSDALNKSIKLCGNLINENKLVYLVELNKKDPSEEGFLSMLDIINKSKPINYYGLLEKKLSKI